MKQKNTTPIHDRIQVRWDTFAVRAGLSSDEALRIFALLDALYSTPGREYHNWTHIHTFLAHMDTWHRYIAESLTFEAAVWFHDAVYTPGRSDNESSSAYLAERLLQKSALSAGEVRRVSDLILTTAYTGSQSPNNTPTDAELFHDLDFSIFAAPFPAVLIYDQAIRSEFSTAAGMTPTLFVTRRRAFLSNLLSYPHIFYFSPMRAAFEATARKRIAALLEQEYSL